MTGILYAINTTREKISPERVEKALQILDELIPVVSGRDYRYQEMTDDHLYEQYCEKLQNGLPVSKSYFVKKILFTQQIWHSKKPKFCNYCQEFESGVNTSKLKDHQDLIKFQRGQYKKEKEEIANGSDDAILITQDFTQLEIETGFIQNLIVVKYSHDISKEDGLRRDYCHFVGEKGNSNGINFVTGCWKTMWQDKWIEEGSKL